MLKLLGLLHRGMSSRMHLPNLAVEDVLFGLPPLSPFLMNSVKVSAFALVRIGVVLPLGSLFLRSSQNVSRSETPPISVESFAR